jgi:hypothetical protein
LRATYETQPTDYLFYVLKGDGKHAFAATGAEHEKNVQFYRKSLKEARREEKKSEASDEEHNSGVPEKTETSDSSNASADVNSSGSKSTNDENSSGVESLEIESPSSDSKVKPKGEVVVEKANSRKSPVPEKTPSKPKKKD